MCGWLAWLFSSGSTAGSDFFTLMVPLSPGGSPGGVFAAAPAPVIGTTPTSAASTTNDILETVRPMFSSPAVRPPTGRCPPLPIRPHTFRNLEVPQRVVRLPPMPAPTLPPGLRHEVTYQVPANKTVPNLYPEAEDV